MQKVRVHGYPWLSADQPSGNRPNYFGLFDREGFPVIGKGLRERDLPVDAETVRVRFTGIPPGR